MDLTCVKCGSAAIIPDAAIMDQGQYSDGALKAKYERNPSAIFFKGRTVTTLRAQICAQFGYTELYANNPETLYDAYREVQDQTDEN